MPEEITAPLTSPGGIAAIITAMGLGSVLTALVNRPSRRSVAATAAKDEATGEAAVIGALANAFTSTTAALQEECERMQAMLNDFRAKLAEAEAEGRAALAREVVKDRLIADQKAQLDIAHNDVVRLRGERDAAIETSIQKEGEIRQLKAVIEAHSRVGG